MPSGADAGALAPARCFAHDLFRDGAVLVQDTTTVAVDLAGFTPLTDRLTAAGSRGTERLSRVLRDYFEGVTDLLVAAGGDPVAFGGDSLSVLFDGPPGSTVPAALEAATRVRGLTAATAPVPVPGGELGLRVRVGVARGSVATAVARTGGRLLPVHVGPGLDLAHAAQESAGTGSVAVDATAHGWPGRAGTPPGPGRPPPPVAAPPPDLDGLLPAALLDRLHRGRPLGQSHRTVTVAFVRYPPVEPHGLPAFLGRVVALADLVLASGGEVVQVSGGDKGVMAMVVHGAPVAHSDDPVRAAHAMLALRRREPLAAVGIATGPVFAAVLGSATRMFPTHTGMAVNVAARLAQRAGPGTLLVDDPTWAAASAHLHARGAPQRVALKGCGSPRLVHLVAGRRRARPRPASTSVTPLVGRRPELERLEQLLDAVAAGHGGSLTLHGPPGIGTSRLAREALDRARTRGFGTVRADVADHPHGGTCGVWRELVGGLLGVPPRASRPVWRDALAGALPDAADVLPVLDPVLGLGAATPRGAADPPDPLDPLDAESACLAPLLAHTALARLLGHGARHHPVVLLIEHADRLDEASADLLHRLGAAAGRCAAGVVLTWGSEDGRAAPPGDHLALGPLGAEDTALLAEEAWRRSGGGTPPPWLAGLVVPYAGGNPMAARAAVQTLRSRWSPGAPPPSEDAVAGSPAGLVSAQVDRLPVDAHDLLTVLAVARRPCAPGLLADLLPGRSPAALRRAGRALVAERLATPRAVGDEEAYRVSHDLVRRVVYEATSHAVRERLHRALVDRLVADDPDPVEVAGHVRPLADPALGRRWFPRAARAARAGWDLGGALGWWERLRPLVAGAELEHVELEVLEVLLVAGRTDEVLGRLERVGTGPGAAPGLAARRLLLLAEASYRCGRLDRTEEAASAVMRMVDGPGATDGADEARYQRAGELRTLARAHRGDLVGAVRAGRALVDRAQGLDAAARATASAALAVAQVLSGRPEEAVGCYRAALEAATEARDVVRQVHVLSDLAGCAYLQGRHQECVELMTRARARADRIGYQGHLALSLNNEAQLRAALGDPYAAACAAASVRRGLDLGDLPQAADAVQTWLCARPALAADAGAWRRLVAVDRGLGRWLEAAAEHAELAVLLARAGRAGAAREAARAAEDAEGAQHPAQHADAVRRRVALARLLADARDGAAGREQVLAGLDRLADDAADEREAAELAVERWRLRRTPAARAEAVRAVRAAFAVEPSALARSWFHRLREPVPTGPDRLPPPVGIARGRTTRRQLEQALLDLEAAVTARPGAAPDVP